MTTSAKVDSEEANKSGIGKKNKQEKTVLICGASIAGPALALFLTRMQKSQSQSDHNDVVYRPVVVERAPELRLGGQNIDIEGPAQEAADLMGIGDGIREHRTAEEGLEFIGPDGSVSASFPMNSTGSMTKELEILRGDLSKILYDKTTSTAESECECECEYIFGDYVVALEEKEEQVAVTFESGKKRNFDLIVAADGSRSKTRELLFGGEDLDEAVLKPLGLYIGFFTIPKCNKTDNNMARWYNSTGSRVMVLRPDRLGTTIRAFVAFMSPPKSYERLPPNELKKVLTEIYKDAGWETDRVMKEMREADVYCDYVCQVKCPRYSIGRGVFLGDAAWSPTPLTGQGSSLAVVGAYVLAGELCKHPHSHRDAFESYEAILREHVETSQWIPSGLPGIMFPSTSMGVWFLNNVLGLAAWISSWFIKRNIGKGKIYAFQLPVYGRESSEKEEEITT
jgi:2-polyprenyl-6-methoxyphenol hydroxylase-like FAD-dependent oxidoreductase